MQNVWFTEQAPWLVFFPPIIVLLTAFKTKKLNQALILGIIIAAALSTQGNLIQSCSLIAQRFIEHISNISTLYLYIFLLTISTFIIFINRTGGVIAFAQAITKKIHSAQLAEAASVFLSSCLFIDDYLSILTVGYVMRPITDQFKIPRAKLAYLVHSLSGPLVIMIPLSSWVAMITGQLGLAGIASDSTHATTTIIADPFYVYLKTVPFIFYSLLTVIAIWFIIYMRISFGPMKSHELQALNNDNMFNGKESPEERVSATDLPLKPGSIWDFIIPLTTLIGSVILGIMYFGNFYLFGGNHTFIEAIQHNSDSTEFILLCSALIALSVGIILALLGKKINISQAPSIITAGICLMYPAIIMVILASTLSAILKIDLQAGNHLALLFPSFLPYGLLPFIFFITAVITAIVTGSSWGTIAILVPMAVPMLVSLSALKGLLSPESIPMLSPLLGAIFSGAVCGDHISPISETTIMTATSTGSYPIDHTHTQLPYALIVSCSTALSFLCIGLISNPGSLLNTALSLGIGMTSCITLLYAMHYWSNKT